MKQVIQESIFRAISFLFEKDASEFFPRERDIAITPPKDESHGDFSTNIGMVLAKPLHKSPIEIARLLAENLQSDERMQQFRIEAVVPGYLNFSYTDEALVEWGETVVGQGTIPKFFETSTGNNAPARFLLEFISANPTGPLHLGNARGGFLGDALSKVLRRAGHAVSTEYYVNDAGEQMEKLGHSVLKDSEAVYGGTYIDLLHEEFECERERKSAVFSASSHVSETGKQQTTEEVLPNPRAVGTWAGKRILETSIKPTLLAKMGIHFDAFVFEKHDVVERGYVDQAIRIFQENHHTFEHDGALWLKTTKFGDDKDRVLVKQTGERTYFASDCGYLLHKKERGFDRVVHILGADHHGYVSRLRAAAEALGFERDAVSCVLVQLVRLVRNGEEVRMSKRAGTVVTIDDLVDMVGKDVARFFFALYHPDTHLNFDLSLAEERSRKNPVYFVQYAHARMSSILGKAQSFFQEEGIPATISYEARSFESVFPLHSKERLLVRHLIKFSDVVLDCSESLTVHQLPQYAIRLADIFHSFYDECVVLDRSDILRTRARLALVSAAQITLGETLSLLGVSAPEHM